MRLNGQCSGRTGTHRSGLTTHLMFVAHSPRALAHIHTPRLTDRVTSLTYIPCSRRTQRQEQLLTFEITNCQIRSLPHLFRLSFHPSSNPSPSLFLASNLCASLIRSSVNPYEPSFIPVLILLEHFCPHHARDRNERKTSYPGSEQQSGLGDSQLCYHA